MAKGKKLKGRKLKQARLEALAKGRATLAAKRATEAMNNNAESDARTQREREEEQRRERYAVSVNRDGIITSHDGGAVFWRYDGETAGVRVGKVEVLVKVYGE